MAKFETVLGPAENAPSQLTSGATDRDALLRILPLWPCELSDRSVEGRRKLLATLARALRAERRRGRAGHWAYDLARHAALLRVYRQEREALAALQKRIALGGARNNS